MDIVSHYENSAHSYSVFILSLQLSVTVKRGMEEKIMETSKWYKVPPSLTMLQGCRNGQPAKTMGGKGMMCHHSNQSQNQIMCNLP